MSELFLTKVKNKNTILAMILLIDSEVIRSPFDSRYCHAQDQQLKPGSLSAIKKAIATGWELFALVDYENLAKSSLFDLHKAKYSTSLLLNMAPELKAIYLLADTKGKVFKYFRSNQKDSKANSRFCFFGQEEEEIDLEPIDCSSSSAIIKLLKQETKEIVLISDRADAEAIASYHNIGFIQGSYWLNPYEIQSEIITLKQFCQ